MGNTIKAFKYLFVPPAVLFLLDDAEEDDDAATATATAADVADTAEEPLVQKSGWAAAARPLRRDSVCAL